MSTDEQLHSGIPTSFTSTPLAIAGMMFSRRQILLAGGLMLVSCRSAVRPLSTRQLGKLDLLLAAHADVLPENGGGANHYPMAAEALMALGHEEAIEDSWIRGADLYAGKMPRVAPIENVTDALGSYERFGDLLDYFRNALHSESWRSVVAHWAPQLAPGISAAAFHGIIRTGHAVRAMRHQETSARRNELAVGLAYWASRYTILPTTQTSHRDDESLQKTLEGLTHPWLDDRTDVGFHAVGDRLIQTEMPVAPPVMLATTDSSPIADLYSLVRGAAAGVLEMLVLKRNRIWLMHTITGPASVGLLLPEVDQAGARMLVAYARQAVVAMFAAYGEPFTSRAHERTAPPAWPTLIQRAVATRSVHTIKLVDSLIRFEADDDLLCRSVAAQWLEWV